MSLYIVVVELCVQCHSICICICLMPRIFISVQSGQELKTITSPSILKFFVYTNYPLEGLRGPNLGHEGVWKGQVINLLYKRSQSQLYTLGNLENANHADETKCQETKIPGEYPACMARTCKNPSSQTGR